MDHVSDRLTTSVKAYAMRLLRQTEDEELKTLLVDLLNYGAEAQSYFGVRTQMLANDALTEEELALSTAQAPALNRMRSVSPGANPTVRLIGSSLSLENRVQILYYLDLSDSGLQAHELELVLQYVDLDGTAQTVRVDGSRFEAREIDGRRIYVASFDRLNAAQMRTVVEAELCSKADQTTVSDKLYYSVECYAASKQNDSDSGLVALLGAMMQYGDAAAAYFMKQ